MRTRPRTAIERPSSTRSTRCSPRSSRLAARNTSKLAELEALLPGLESPSVIPLAHEGMIAIHSVVGSDDVWGLLPRLKAAGATGILVLPIEKIVP